MTKSLLIEIGVEELPAIPLLKIIKKIEKSWAELLKEYHLASSFTFLYTPRRLVIRTDEMPIQQADSIIEFKGPPVFVGIKDGKPTKAGEGFARKCGVDFDDLQRETLKGKEILYYKKEQQGKQTSVLLSEMIGKWIETMAFGKMMRWGDKKEEFIRPIRWLQVRLDNDIVPCELFGVVSDNKTSIHRMVSYDSVEVADISKYQEILSKGGVMLNPDDRKSKILKEFDEIEVTNGVKIELDISLLDEVVAITENPKALLGTFDALFLTLPPEVIITSMKEHQRYFPVYKNGKISNHFVVVSNAYTDDYTKVIAGNERVLKPRLADGLFFYNNDLKNGLSTKGLQNVQFIDGLGSLSDKIEREKHIAYRLSTLYMNKLKTQLGEESEFLQEDMSRAISLAKADLMSEMVYEFTELQGLMGYYYAKALGEKEHIYRAIKEQYMPLGEGAELPTSVFSAIVAMSIKLDTLIGLFSVGKIPTGSKDPFALRRSVNGIVRIVIKYDLVFEISDILESLQEQYKAFDIKLLKDFMIERINKSLDANPSVIASVLSTGEEDINEINKKVSALNDVVSKESFKEQFSTFKRVANISKDVDLSQNLKVEESLFEEESEKALYEEYQSIISKSYSNYKDNLNALFSLNNTLNNYFDNVMVNVEDDKIKENRLNTVASIYKSFKSIADIKEIGV